MATRTINHKLRTIELKFEDGKPETDYEQMLVKAYVAMHDQIAALMPVPEKLKYLYTEHDDHVTETENDFLPVEEGIGNLFTELSSLLIQKDEDEIAAFYDRVQDYYPNIEEFQKQLDGLSSESDDLEEQHKAYSDDDEKLSADFEKYHHETCGELYHNYDNYSLDLVSYDQDEQEFRGLFSTLGKADDAYSDLRNEVIDHYNEVISRIKASYDKWDEMKKMLSNYYDDQHLLDNSQSESYAEGTGDPASKPLYLIQPGDKRIKEFRNQFGLFANSRNKTMVINIPVETVNAMDTGMLEEIVLVLQHFPKMIDKMLFAIELAFSDEDGMRLPDDEWKGFEAPMRWCRQLSRVPCLLFFLSDEHARSFFLFGDLANDEKIKPEFHKGEPVLKLEGEMLQEACNRLGEACWFFHVFCHNTGFDPQPYIEAILADFDFPITYEQIREKFEADLKKGIHVGLGPVK